MTVDNRGTDNGSILVESGKNHTRKRPIMAIRLGFLMEKFFVKLSCQVVYQDSHTNPYIFVGFPCAATYFAATTSTACEQLRLSSVMSTEVSFSLSQQSQDNYFIVCLLQEKLASGPFLQDKVKECFKDNPHCLTLVMSPDVCVLILKPRFHFQTC